MEGMLGFFSWCRSKSFDTELNHIHWIKSYDWFRVDYNCFT